MDFFRKLSLRTQLLALALLLTLPSIGIIIYTGIEQRNNALEEAALETRKLAGNIAAEQERLTQEAYLVASFISKLSDFNASNLPKVQKTLSNILEDNPQFLNILLADRKGNVWASAIPTSKRLTITGLRYFKNAHASRRFSSGEYGPNLVTGKPALSMGYPLFDARGEFDGLIAVNFNLDQFKSVLERSKLPDTASYVISDHKGTVIGKGNSSPSVVGSNIRADVLEYMENDPDKGTYDHVRFDGNKRIISYRKLWLKGEQEPYVYIRAGLSHKAVVEKSNIEMLHNILLFMPFVLAAFGLTFYIGKRSITDRAAIMNAAAQELALGNTPGRIGDLIKGGELGRLGETFDKMVDKIKAREQELRESEAHYRAMIDAYDGLIYICSADYRIEFMNERMINDLGYDATGEICYKANHGLDSTCPWCVNNRVFAGETVRWVMQSPRNNRWYNITNTPIYNADGTISKQAMIFDITEQKQAEQTLQEQTAQLEHEIAERKTAQEMLLVKQQQLETLNNSLEERIFEAIVELRSKDKMLIQQSRQAAMGEMINNIAHQWRQPLNNIGLIVQNFLFSYEIGKLDKNDVEAGVAQAMDTIRFMSQTIDDFRNFFRQDKEKQEFSLNIIVKEILDFVSPSLSNNNITVIIEEKEPVAAFGYRNEYAQVLLNIINNAKDVLLDRCVEKPQINIRILNANNRTAITIQDNAGGIKDNILPQIFDPYFSTKDFGKGTGIGLYMSKMIIEHNMGGQISAQNTAGGVEFRIEV